MSTPLKKISIHSSGEQARTQCERTSIFGHFVGIWGSQCNSCFLLVGIWGTQTQTKINPSYYQFYKNLQLQLQEWWVNVWKTQPRIRSSLNLCFGVYSVKSAKTGQRSIKLWDQPALPFNAGVEPKGRSDPVNVMCWPKNQCLRARVRGWREEAPPASSLLLLREEEQSSHSV